MALIAVALVGIRDRTNRQMLSWMCSEDNTTMTQAGLSSGTKPTHFAVFIRYVKCLESHVLAASGQHGVYIEPKTEDALKPHGEYQVVWLPQMDFQAVSHKAKCEVDCLGLARTGQRYGLRVHVKDFQRLFTQVKPDAVYLAPGHRTMYHCGLLVVTAKALQESCEPAIGNADHCSQSNTCQVV